MKTCVQKFGGSSLISVKQRKQVVDRITRTINDGYQPVVVVSAMGRAKDPYATDTLIELVKEINSDPCLRNMDMLLSCGEIISAVVLAETLNQLGYTAVALTGWQSGIITDENFGNARILSVNTDLITKLLEEGKIPIVTGFQGCTLSGEVTTLGRGGSDTTAVALGAALSCDTVEIYTDVDGVKTADPRLIPDAPTISSITYQEIMELAHLGTRVIHPRAVEIAMEAGIELKILGLDQLSCGTIIRKGLSGRIDPKQISDRVVTGIAQITGCAHVKISGVEDFNKSHLTLIIFDILATKGVSVDLIYLSPKLIAFIIDDKMSALVREVLADLGLNIIVDLGYAKVSVVGAGMHGVPGVMARVVRSLDQANVPIYQTTDSHANISCLIKEKKLAAAVRALFDEFELSKEGVN